MTQLSEPPVLVTVRQQIEANVQHVRTQQANMMLQKQQAEAAVEKLTVSLAQAEGAIAAYEETLRILPPDPVVPPVAEKPVEPPAQEAAQAPGYVPSLPLEHTNTAQG